MSSATMKMRDPNFLAIEMASLAIGRGNQSSSRVETREGRTVGLALVVVPSLVYQLVVDVSRLDGVQEVEEELAVLESGILKAPHAAALASLLYLVVRPSHDVTIRDLLPAFAQTRHRREDVPPHHLPDETEGEGTRSVDEVGSLDSNELEVESAAEIDSVVRILDGLEAGEGKGSFGDSAPGDGAGRELVEGLEENESVLPHQIPSVTARAWFVHRSSP